MQNWEVSAPIGWPLAVRAFEGVKKTMVDFLTYYYVKGAPPFRSLSALPDDEAIALMEALYVKYAGSIVFERFKDPAQYLHNRKQTEQWVREAFTAKGRQPQDAYPISMVLGNSPWLEKHAPDGSDANDKILIPLSALQEDDVSFTFPDSMVSHWLSRDQPPEYYLPGYHGQVFTLSEILAIVETRGMPEEKWQVNHPSHVGSYIEAQVWNHKLLLEYTKQGVRSQ
jgi:hypothetical protein